MMTLAAVRNSVSRFKVFGVFYFVRLSSPDYELKNELIQQGRYTDCVDELIFKMTKAPVKKVKVDRKSFGCVI